MRQLLACDSSDDPNVGIMVHDLCAKAVSKPGSRDSDPSDCTIIIDLYKFFIRLLPPWKSSLDAVVYTASIEYLVRPAEVLAETLRVLRPGGVVVITFSNRWFPTKAIRIWSELHEFERVGMVTQWLQQKGFTGLHTFSSRGWPRPVDDLHADKTPYSDPVYAVWGYKPGD